MAYLKDFQNQISNRDYTAFVRLWEEYCVGDEVDPLELKAILVSVKGCEFAESFGKHVEKIIPIWEEIPEGDQKDEIFKLIIDLETTNNEPLYDYVMEYFKKKYGNQADFVEKIRLIGFRNKNKVQGSVSSFELLNHMKKGNFVFHAGGWGIGEIIDVSMLREQLAVEFEYVSGKKDISFTNAFKTLIPIPSSHFWARRFSDFEQLEKEAKENPVEVIRLLLQDLGPKTAPEIKDELCEWVIPKEEWTKWWQNARAKLKKDIKIESPDGARSVFALKEQAISHEERLRKALEEDVDVEKLIVTIHPFVRDFSETLKKVEFKNFLEAKIQGKLEASDLTEIQILELHLLLEELSGDKFYGFTQEIIKNCKNLEAVVQSTEILAFKKRILVIARKSRADWKDLFLNLLLTVDQNPIRDYLFNELFNLKTEAELKNKLGELLIHFSLYPRAFVWYFQKITTRRNVPYSDKEGRSLFFESFFMLLNHIESVPSYRELVKKMPLILTKDRYAVMRALIQEMSIDTVQELLLLASKCRSFSDHDMKIFHSLAEIVHPSLAKMRKKQENISEDYVIWTTEKGYAKIKDRIELIGTVETIKNSEEIKEARSHGDLRENPAFKAALEKQEHLQSELKMLSDQLSWARILSKADINTEEVGVGCVVECKNNKGNTRFYTLLGPWDADPDKGILSLQSKLAQEMKGLPVNGKFNFQGEELTIVKITSCLDDNN